MPPKKKKKKKTQKFNVENILKGIVLDLMRAGKIPGEEGSSIVGAMQLRKKLAEMPQGGGITPLMPISPLDLAFETLATGLAHAEGVDPRLAIAGSVAAARYAPSAARAVNVEGGGYLSRRAYKKGMESASKDPMFADIDYSKEVGFIRPDDPLAKTFAGRYMPDAGSHRRHYELYPNQKIYDTGPNQPSIELAERTLFSLLSPNIGKRIGKPDILKSKEWAESTVRHESRHYKQHVEGMKRREAESGAFGGYGSTNYPLEYGYPSGYGEMYSTLIKIPTPKNKWPMIDKKYIDKKTGNPKKPSEVHEMIELEHGKKAAKKYTEWYKQKVKKETIDAQRVDRYGKDYYQQPIEVEARIEEISALGDKNILSAKNIRAFKDLKDRAGYSTEQILDMVTEYRIAKKKYDPIKYKAQAYEAKGFSFDIPLDKYKKRKFKSIDIE